MGTSSPLYGKVTCTMHVHARDVMQTVHTLEDQGLVFELGDDALEIIVGASADDMKEIFPQFDVH